jgi:tetratricopeptide (TPR) repeat protein
MKTAISLWILFFCCSISIAQHLKTCDSLIRLGVEQLGQNDHIVSLESLNKAFVMANDHGWHDQAFLALNNIGANYYALLNYGEALHYYLEAYQVAISHLENTREMIVLNNIALLYLSDHEYKKAAEYGERAYEIARKVDHQKRMALYAVNLGLIYNKMGETDKAAFYFTAVLKIDFPDPNINLINKIGQTENLLLTNNYEQALTLAVSILPEVQRKENYTQLSHLYLLLSKIHLKLERATEAVEFCNKSIATAPDLEKKISGYQHLADIYMSQKKFENTIAVKDSIWRYTDSLNRVKNGKYFESNKVSFELKKYQQDAINSKLELKQQQKFHYALLGGVGAVFLVLVWGFRNSHLKNKHKKDAAEREREIAVLELDRKQNEKLILEKQMLEKEAQLKLEQAELKNEIELKNRKLSTKALYMAERNELIKHIIGIINKQEQLVAHAAVKNELKKLKKLVKNDGSWDDFTEHFEAVNNGYLEKLKFAHPTLNNNDLRFLSYLYMNLSQKEISTILSISPDACRKRKERISKKIGLTDSTGLYNYLYSI